MLSIHQRLYLSASKLISHRGITSPVRSIATADLCDDHIQSPPRFSIATPNYFKDYGNRKKFHGQIETIRCFESNPLVRKTLQTPGAGKVLVVDGAASTRVALMGDMLAEFAFKNGWAGVVINGCIRDSRAISEIDVGVKAIGTQPVKSRKDFDGDKGVSVSFAGVEFVPGHWIYCDEDGVIISEHEMTK